MCVYIHIYIYIYIYRHQYRCPCTDIPQSGGPDHIILAVPLVGASNVGGFLCRCDPHTQTLFVFRCQHNH